MEFLDIQGTLECGFTLKGVRDMIRIYSQELTDYHSANVDEVNKKLEDIGRRVEEIKLDKINKDFATKTKKN